MPHDLLVAGKQNDHHDEWRCKQTIKNGGPEEHLDRIESGEVEGQTYSY
jgi:hypothetical protein